MYTIKELKDKHFPSKLVCEIEDKEQANSLFKSRTSSCWGNAVIGETGWAVVGQPSPQHKGDTPTVFVCKTELLERN